MNEDTVVESISCHLCVMIILQKDKQQQERNTYFLLQQMGRKREKERGRGTARERNSHVTLKINHLSSVPFVRLLSSIKCS